MKPTPTPHETLAATLRRAAEDLQQAAPPPLPVLRPASDRAGTARPGRGPRRPAWRLGPALGVCLAVLFASTVLLLAGGGPPASSGADERRADVAETPSAFVTVVGADRWDQLVADGDERAWLVSTELPRERLAALGLPYDPGRAGERVRAELLMHASGDVLAVRVLH